MARIRTVKPEIHTDVKTGTLSDRAFRLFIGLLNLSDRHGVVEWELYQIKALLYPHLLELPEQCILPAFNDELFPRGLAVLFTHDQKQYLWLPNFKKHQKIDPRNERELLQNFETEQLPILEQNLSKWCNSDLTVTQHRCISIGKERKGKERKGKEQGKEGVCVNTDSEIASSFESFWAVYPKKVGKGAARAAWKKISPGNELAEVILGAVAQQKESHQWQKDGGQFIPHPATWLNQNRWEDSLDEMPSPNEPKGFQGIRDYLKEMEVEDGAGDISTSRGFDLNNFS